MDKIQNLLQDAVSCGIVNTTEIENIVDNMSKQAQVNKVHQQKINFRTDGRCYTYVYINSKRKQKNFNTEKELYNYLYDFYFGRNKISLQELFPEWMQYRRDKGKVSAKTIEENLYCWNRFLKNTTIVSKPISSLTVQMYINYFEELTKDGIYTSKCIGNLKSLLNKMHDYAIRENLVNNNPIKSIDSREFNYYIPYNDDEVYKENERIKLLNYLENIDDVYALAIRFMFQMTIRIGELKAFRWSDVNIDERTIIVANQTLTTRQMNDDLSFSARETKVVNYTKKNTPQGKRKLYLTNEAVRILEKAKELNPDGEYIFMPFGRLMLTDTFNERLKKYTTDCGIPYYSSHKIRFTTSSTLYNGQNLIQVSKALGHSQIATTLHYFRNTKIDDGLLDQMELAFSID